MTKSLRFITEAFLFADHHLHNGIPTAPESKKSPASAGTFYFRT